MINDSSDNQIPLTDSSSLSSSSSSISGDRFTLEAYLPLVTNQSEPLKKFKRLLSRLDQVYNKKNMATKTLYPSSSHLTDRYFFRSHSTDPKHFKIKHKNKLNNNNISPRSTKRYKFSSPNTNQYHDNVYKFPTKQNERRSYSSDSNRYYFKPEILYNNSQRTLTYVRSNDGSEQCPVTFIDGTSHTPYLFSNTSESQRYSSTTTSAFIRPEGKTNS